MTWVANHHGYTLGINNIVCRDLDDSVELTKMAAAPNNKLLQVMTYTTAEAASVHEMRSACVS